MKTMNDFIELFNYLPPQFPLSLIRDCSDRYDAAKYRDYEYDTKFFGGSKLYHVRFWWRESYQCSELGTVSTKNYVTFYFVPRGYRVILLHPEYDYYLNDLALHCERVIAFERSVIVRNKEQEGIFYLTVGNTGFAVIDSSTEQFQLFGGDTSLSVLLSMDYSSVFYQFRG